MVRRPTAVAPCRVAAAVCAALLAVLHGRVAAEEEPNPFRFRDLTVLSGGTVDFGTPKSAVGMASGGFVDVDGDGWDDVVTLTGPGEPCGYFLNRPDGAGGRTFVPAPPGNGLDDGAAFERDGIALAAGDVDGDGDTDLFVGVGWNPKLPSGTNILLLNDGTGRFTDATAAAGLLDGDNTTGGVAFFDFDLDGDLDLVTVNSDFPGVDKYGDGRTHLWRNQLAETGALTFVDEAELRGLAPEGVACWAVLTPDYDGDGDFDVLVTHDGFGTAQLFRNDGTGGFAEVTDLAGSGPGDDGDPSTFGNDSRAAMGAAAIDFDNDGDLDLYVTNQLRNPLYVNHGDGTFHEGNRTAGLSPVRTTWGCTWADFDLDGVLDAYVAGGPLLYQPPPDLARSYLYQGLPGGRFRELWTGAGFLRDEARHREMGTATADFDRDGRPDLLVVRAEQDGGSPYLYRNESDTAGRRWLAVEPRGDGVRSNVSAIGARIRVLPRDAAGRPIPELQRLHEVASGDSRAAMSSLTHNFGLGPDAAAADVAVTWPRPGTHAERTNLYPDVALDRVLRVRDDTPPHWRLAESADASVGGGATTRIVLAGAGPHTAVACTIVRGGGIASVGPAEDGAPTLDLSPPAVTRAEVTEIEILAVVDGVPGTGSRQTLRVTVQAVPVVERILVKQRGQRLVIRGRALPAASRVLVDGVAATWVRPPPKQRRDGAYVTELRVRTPKGVRRSFRRSAHAVEVIDPATLATSGPVAIPAR